MKNRSGRCINCKKYLGITIKKIPEGTVDDGTNFYCNDKCYTEFKEKIGVREGKTFIEFKDFFGWTTRINFRKNPIDIEFKQISEETNRYIYLKEKETELFLKKLREFAKE